MIKNDGNAYMSKGQQLANQVERPILQDTKRDILLSDLVKELFGSTINILGAETGGGEPLADFIVKGN